METIFINLENSKTNKPHQFVLNLLQRLDLNMFLFKMYLFITRRKYKKTV